MFESFLLQFSQPSQELVIGDGQLGPGVEYFGGRGPAAALEFGLDSPGQVGSVVLAEDGVGHVGVGVFGVNQQAV